MMETDEEEKMSKGAKSDEELPDEALETDEELEKTGEASVEETVEEETTEEEALEEEESIEERAVEEKDVDEKIEKLLDGEEEPERREEERREEILEDRVYTIPLGRAWISPPKKRAPRAIRIIRNFIIRHMKIKVDAVGEAERLIISNEVNEKIWTRGMKKPPRKIRVRAIKDVDGNVTLHLAEGN